MRTSANALIALYIITFLLVWGVIKIATPPARAVRPACKVQMVEVTKSEGTVTWTDVEPMCVESK